METERLRLRLHEPVDAGWLHRVYSQPRVARYLLDEPWSRDDAAERVSERLVKTDLNGDAGALALVVEHEGMPIGDVLLWLVDTDRGVAEIGWVLDPSHSGRGFGREAVNAVLRSVFDHYRLHRVSAQMDARNTASAKLAAAVGMHREHSASTGGCDVRSRDPSPLISLPWTQKGGTTALAAATFRR